MRVRTDSDDTAKTPKKPARQNDSPVTLATLAVAARREAQPSPPLARAVHSITTLADLAPTPPLAPQGLIVRLPSTRMLFPAVNQLKETGHNTLATGTPVASRMVIYNNTVDDNKRVTYAVDVYADAGAAHVAYWDAVKLSLQAGGFSPLTDPRIGNESFAGTSAGEGGQKHIGVGVRIGNIVIGATHAGYDTDPATIRKIVYLARVQAFKAAVMAPFYNIFGWP